MKKVRNIFKNIARWVASWFKGDPTIWWCVFALSIISSIYVFSAIGRVASSAPVWAWMKHMGFVVLGWTSALGLCRVNYRKFAKISKYALWAAIGLLVLAMALGGRWLHVGSSSFQPSEFAKIALIVSIAKLLATNTSKLNDLDFFIKLTAIMLGVVAVILKDNFSTAALVCIICFLMMFFGGINLKYWWRLVSVLTLVTVIFLSYSYFDYKSKVEAQETVESSQRVLERGETWSHRVYTWVTNDHDEANQINMARTAIARGKIKGVGVGSTVIARLLPQSDSDFIYAIIIEESGFALGIFLLFIYALLCLRCIKMSDRCTGTFGSLLLGGLGSYIFIQALVHMSYNVGVIPVTGQTLPFVSHGGSSQWMFGVALGIIQSVCSDVRAKEQERKEEELRQKEFRETYEIAREENS